ncbi:MAG: family 16 glycosylhydrolase [Marmoricola sp.]
MKHLVALAAVLMMALTGAVALGAPAEAASSAVRLARPTAHHVGRSVVMTGKVKGHARKVHIQQRKNGRWVVVRTAAVRHGVYQVSLNAPARTQLRASVAGRVSPTVVVAAAATDACGTVIKKADGTPWTCTFHDDFSGTALDPAKWQPQTQFAMGTQAAHACYRDDPANVNVAGGSLNLSVTKLTTPMSCSFGGLSGPTSYASGSVMTHGLFSQQFGRFEARIKSTATSFPGLQESFWMWPDDRVKSSTSSLPWPFSGEMDVSETYSSHPTISIPYLHYNASTALGVVTAWNCLAQRGVWNTYAAEWSATKVQLFVNGRLCLTNTAASAAYLKPYILALSQGLGAAGNVYDGRAPLGTMSVDYVRVWK